MRGKYGNAGQVCGEKQKLEVGAPLTLFARAAPLPIRRANCGARARDGKAVVVVIKRVFGRVHVFFNLGRKP